MQKELQTSAEARLPNTISRLPAAAAAVFALAFSLSLFLSPLGFPFSFSLVLLGFFSPSNLPTAVSRNKECE